MAASEGDKTAFLRNKCLTADNWSLYPAITDVNMTCNKITSVSDITFCDNGVKISDISGVLNISGPVIFDSPPQTPAVPTLGSDLVNKTYADSVVSSEVSLWAEEPAVTDVDMSCNVVTRVGDIIFCDGSSITTEITSLDISSGKTIELITSGVNNVEVYPGMSGGLHIYSQNSNPPSNPELKIENKNANAVGGQLQFYKNSDTPANNDTLGTITMYGKNITPVVKEFCEIRGLSTITTAGSEQGQIDCLVRRNAPLIVPLRVRVGGIEPTGITDITDSVGPANHILCSTGVYILWRSLSDIISTGITATGGNIISSYTVNGVRYTAHTFINPAEISTFSITSLGTDPLPTLDILMVGGGGSGGGGQGTPNPINGGGGGAGAVMFFKDIPLIPTTPSVLPYVFFPIQIGSGGSGVATGRGNPGNPTIIVCPQALFTNHNPTVIFNPLQLTIRCPGGGGGGGFGNISGGTGSGTAIVNYNSFNAGAATVNTFVNGAGGGGGSGGGVGGTTTTFFTSGEFGDMQGLSFTGGARNGGTGEAVIANAGGGGGGARGIGFTAGTANVSTITECTPGGGGLRFNLDATSRFIGGGGQGAGTSRPATPLIGSTYGGGLGYASSGGLAATPGAANTGGGGGGGGPVAGSISGNGGSGLVIFRYRS